MNKRDRIDQILSQVKEQTDEFLEAEEMTGMDLTPEEMVVGAVELVTGGHVTQIEYTMPVGRVDLNDVSFMISDEIQIQLTGLDEVDDDED